MAALTAVGSIASGVMGFMQADYQGQVASMNAKVARWNAVQASQRSQIEQQNQDAKSAGMIGELVAQQSGSGVSLGSGSSAATRSAAARLGRRDALNIRQAGETDVYNYLTQAANFKAQAGASQLGGFSELLGGFLGGASSLVGGASSTPSQFSWMAAS